MPEINTELNTVKELVEKVLSRNVATRSNDTKLYLECCKELGCKTMKDIERMNLSIITVHKLRQVIQNKEGHYNPAKEVLAIREKRHVSIREYMVRVGN
ncbi:hypothetical protein RND61_15465 [Streptomyces sp. TRM76323]|uniref:DNA-binding protein n=1 Tax=Streptomyces tamarix TaxID=3078565 RepID=A0ABU3QL20_9ACTN|nr:hypothetical protein [Streptomyces tamarix]MDT9683446.1 hypothetical protein [Streptomyces tamarix]